MERSEREKKKKNLRPINRSSPPPKIRRKRRHPVSDSRINPGVATRPCRKVEHGETNTAPPSFPSKNEGYEGKCVAKKKNEKEEREKEWEKLGRLINTFSLSFLSYPLHQGDGRRRRRFFLTLFICPNFPNL